MNAEIAWCPQCYRRSGAGSSDGGNDPRFSGGPVLPVAAPAPRADPVPARPPGRPAGRFSASATTFGPVGRVVCTVLLTLPMVLFVFLMIRFSPVAGIIAMVVYDGFLFPLAMKDIWRRADRPHN